MKRDGFGHPFFRCCRDDVYIVSTAVKFARFWYSYFVYICTLKNYGRKWL